jgi:hypothetical protein
MRHEETWWPGGKDEVMQVAGKEAREAQKVTIGTNATL